MSSVLYNNFKKLELSGNAISWMNSGIYVMLVSGSYNPSTTLYKTHTVTGDIGAHEVVDANGSYTKGGAQLTSKAVGVGSPAGTDVAYCDAADVTWANTSLTASGAVIYQSGSTAALNYLIAWLDFGGNKTSSNGSFTISWNTAGIINNT